MGFLVPFISKTRLDEIRREIAEIREQSERFELQTFYTQGQLNARAARSLRLQELKAELLAMMPEQKRDRH